MDLRGLARSTRAGAVKRGRALGAEVAAVTRHRVTVLAAVLAVLCGWSYVSGCDDAETPTGNGSGACPTQTATKRVVRMLGSPDFRFDPQNVTIDRGDTVVWCNESKAIHTTTSGAACLPDGLWDSGTMSTNTRFTVVFDSTGVDTTGTIPYHCIPHCNNFNMTGTVTINP